MRHPFATREAVSARRQVRGAMRSAMAAARATALPARIRMMLEEDVHRALTRVEGRLNEALEMIAAEEGEP